MIIIIIIIIIYNAPFPFRYDRSAVAKRERALRYIFKDKSACYQDLLQRIRLPSMETRRIQDMLLTINNSISDKAPPRIRDLITLRSSKYILRNDYILSLPKVNSTKYSLMYGDILPLRNGASYQMISKLKRAVMK